MRVITSITCLFIFLVSCGSKEELVPSLTYEKEKISKVIADMEFADQLLSNAQSKDSDITRKNYLKDIGEIHKVDMELIYKDIKEVQKSPELYKEIMEEAIKILDQKPK